MSKTINIQDIFLNEIRKNRIVVVVFLTNGFQLKGMIRGFDSFVVILDVEGKQQMVYKHAISTIIPSKKIQMMTEEQ